MINRIRNIRKEKRLTLADVARRCSPPTTAQTIGRLETGMRKLSLEWMNRIAAALEVEPELLVRAEGSRDPKVVARLTASGVEALNAPRDAVLPIAFARSGNLMVLAVDSDAGEYRAADHVWVREAQPGEYPRLVNRDVLVPRPGGRFVFGRLLDRDGARLRLLPPGAGQSPLIIDDPAWLAVAEMLVRTL